MQELQDLVTPEAIASGVSAGSKKKLFMVLAELAAKAYGLDASEVAAGLAAREKLGTTGFGGGIAIPHCRVEGVDRVCGAIVLLERPLDYGAVDDNPVDLIFALFSPVVAGAEHLKALARVSRKLREAGFTAKLRGAGSADAIYAMVAGTEAREPAL